MIKNTDPVPVTYCLYCKPEQWMIDIRKPISKLFGIYRCKCGSLFGNYTIKDGKLAYNRGD